MYMSRINRRRYIIEDSDDEDKIIFENIDFDKECIQDENILNTIFTIFKKMAIFSLNCFYKYIKFTLKASGIYLLWISLHYGASHLYIKFCVPNTFYGYLISPFLTPTPHCQGLRWVIYRGAEIINNMWFLLGTWLATSLIFFTQKDEGEKI